MAVQPETYSETVRRLHGEDPDVPQSLLRVRRGPVRRRTARRLRVFFLRQLRATGEVGEAAKRTGVPLSTVYRWREHDEAFRRHWERLLQQRLQLVEDRMIAIVCAGEQTTVFHQGKEVGWRRHFSHRATMRALDYLGRGIRHPASRSEAPQPTEKHSRSTT